MKPNIAFVTGGYSGEAVISYKSAVTIEQNLDSGLYNIFKIDITPQGWFYLPANGEKIPVRPPIAAGKFSSLNAGTFCC